MERERSRKFKGRILLLVGVAGRKDKPAISLFLLLPSLFKFLPVQF
jgi:hypothetical protein